jgi:hypothetical protein
MEVACGQCLGCRVDYSRMWGMRIVHEAAMWESHGGNCFITLTYRDEKDCDLDQWNAGQHVPKDWSLHKSHMDAFFKRLRKWEDKRAKRIGGAPRRFRYFYAGEYGKNCKHGINLELVNCPLCNTGRPHFHVCLFNFRFEDLEAYQSNDGIMRYTSPTLAKIWGYGFVDVGELNFASASYTAKYVLKKVRKVQSDHHYMTYDLDGEVTFISPEFVSMSRGNAAYKGQRCGIGASWYEKYKRDIYPSDEVPVPGAGVMKGVPRYYDEILREENPELYEEMKSTRKAFMKEHKEEYTPRRLEAKHKCKKARIELFGRKTL